MACARTRCVGSGTAPVPVVVLLLCASLVRCNESLKGDVAITDDLLQNAEALVPWLTRIRRELHEIPELAYNLDKTSQAVREYLEELGIPYKHPVAQSGIVATIGTGEPTIALRSDMDALPIHEETGLDFKSKTDGLMHACGHDTHMTMLLGAARLLKGREAGLAGSVRLLFQPAEEGGAGGAAMVAEGALAGCAGVHGLHVWPGLPSGTIASKDGVIMAASTTFEAVIEGRGGHGAMPHLAIDPVTAAAHVVTALQVLVARETSPTDSTVVTVARFNTGEGAANVIPDRVVLAGTIRALTAERFRELKARVAQVVRATAEAHRCAGRLEWKEVEYGPVTNAPELVAHVEAAAGGLKGATWERLDAPTLAAEDFSFMADVVPGAFTFLGIRNETAGAVHGLHTPRFKMDETVLPLGAALHASVALRFLVQHAAHSASSMRNEL